MSGIAAGWPRPWAPWSPGIGSTFEDRPGVRLPVPWAAEELFGTIDFGTLRTDASHRLGDRVCQVCGLSLGTPILLGVAQLVEMRETSGPGCHPRCFALSLKHCPHFGERYGEDEAVAFVYYGDGPGCRLHGPGVGPDRFDVDPAAQPVTRDQVRRLVASERDA